jgi:hypothetical protein
MFRINILIVRISLRRLLKTSRSNLFRLHTQSSFLTSANPRCLYTPIFFHFILFFQFCSHPNTLFCTDTPKPVTLNLVPPFRFSFTPQYVKLT